MTTEYSVHKTDLSKVIVDRIIPGEIFLVDRAELSKTRAGKDYYTIYVSNRFGSSTLKVWDPKSVILDNHYLEIFLKGTNNSKFGDQWKVTHYLKTDYEGDPYFKKSEDVDFSELFKVFEDFKFEDFTCQSLFEVFKKPLEDENSKERYLVPKSTRSFSKKGGLLTYISQLITSYNSIPGVDKDLYLISAIYHHLGSLSCYEITPDERYILNEDFFLVGLENLSLDFLEKSKSLCFSKNLPINPTVYKVIKSICREVFKDTYSSAEAVALSGMSSIVEKINSLGSKINSPQGFILEKGKLLINTREIMNNASQKS